MNDGTNPVIERVRRALHLLRDSQGEFSVGKAGEKRITVGFDALCNALTAGHDAADLIAAVGQVDYFEGNGECLLEFAASKYAPNIAALEALPDEVGLREARDLIVAMPVSEVPYLKGEGYEERFERIKSLVARMTAALAKVSGVSE